MISSCTCVVERARGVRTYRNDTLAGEGLDFSLSVLFPVSNVLVVSHSEGSASEDDGADIVVEAGSADGFLVGLGSTSLLGQDEPGTDPDGGSTQSQGSGERLAVENATGGNQLDALAGEFGVWSFSEDLGDGGDEDAGGNVTLQN